MLNVLRHRENNQENQCFPKINYTLFKILISKLRLKRLNDFLSTKFDLYNEEMTSENFHSQFYISDLIFFLKK